MFATERMMKLRDVGAGERHQKGPLLKDSTVREIGAGTEECALALASAVKHVYAADVSPAMLEYARQKAERRHVKNVTFETGGFLSGFSTVHPVDGVVESTGAAPPPDFWKSRATASIAIDANPERRDCIFAMLYSSRIDDYNAFFKEAIHEVRSRAGDEAAQQTIRHIKAEFSTLDWILEGMIARSGLRILKKGGTGFLSIYVCEK